MILLLVLMLFLPFSLNAQEILPTQPSDSEQIALDQAVSEAIQNNRELKAARYDLEIARARLITAKAFPNPQLQSEQSTDLFFGNEGEYNFSAGISQQFPIARRISKQKAVAKIDIKLAEVEIADQERLLISEVKKTFYDLLLADAQISLKDTLIQTARDLASMTQSRFKRGEISQVDVATADVELQRLIAERERLVVDRQILQNDLSRLIGRSSSVFFPQGSLESTSGVSYSLEELVEQAYQNRPDLTAATYQIDRSRAEQTLARSQKWEDWNAGVSYTRVRSIFDNAVPVPLRDTDQLFNFGISIPLPLRDKKAGPIAEAMASEKKAQASVEALRLDIASQVTGAFGRLSKMSDVINIYRSAVLTASEKNIDLVQKAYKQGMANFLQIILATQQMANQRQSYLEALGQYQQAQVDLETAVGRPMRLGNPK